MQPVAVVEAEEQLSRGRGAGPLVERDPIDGGRRARISELAGRDPHDPGHEHERGAAVRRELETVELKARHVGPGRRRLGEGDVLPPRGREEVDERLLLPRHQQAAAPVGGDAVRPVSGHDVQRLPAKRAGRQATQLRPADRDQPVGGREDRRGGQQALGVAAAPHGGPDPLGARHQRRGRNDHDGSSASQHPACPIQGAALSRVREPGISKVWLPG